MKKRVLSILFVLLMLFPLFVPVQACDEDQSNEYLTQLLFGSSSTSKAKSDKYKMLDYAVYLCSEQIDNQGTDKLNYLKQNKVKVSSLEEIKINKNQLVKCTHTTWDYVDNKTNSKKQNRKKILQNTVNKVFDFGFFSSKTKKESVAQLLYYFHILADYVTEDALDTKVTIKSNKKIFSVSYSGEPSVEINGNKPTFTNKDLDVDLTYAGLDSKGRAGYFFIKVDPERVGSNIVGPRENIDNIKPSGWNQGDYSCLVNTKQLYNRCHLVAHSLGGLDKEINLITGTRYLNWEGMQPYEDKVLKYVQDTGNHVLYRVTPIYDGNNLLASGVQMEGYSIEDNGEGICFNVYCFNVQPGVEIDYATGKNNRAELTYYDNNNYNDNVLAFALSNVSEENPDLIFEINECLETIFEDQKDSSTYKNMMKKIDTVATNARNIGGSACSVEYSNYLKLKKIENEYYNVLKEYVPKLLKEEDFFKEAFN